MPAGISIMNRQIAYKFNAKSYYYHVCVISRSGDINAVKNHVNRFLSEFKVLAIGYGYNPFIHAHIIIQSRKKIDFRKYHVTGLFVKFIHIRSRLHFDNVFEYVTNHPETLIYHDEKVMDGGGKMVDGLDEIKEMLVNIQRRLDTIENRIDALENDVKAVKMETNDETANVERKTLADKVSAKAQTSNGTKPDAEPERIEVRTRIATFIVQKSRKGVALRIRFAPFVKPNQKGEYYLSLTPDEFKALAVQLNNAVNSFVQSGSGGRNKKSGNVKIERGFKKALEE